MILVHVFSGFRHYFEEFVKKILDFLGGFRVLSAIVSMVSKRVNPASGNSMLAYIWGSDEHKGWPPLDHLCFDMLFTPSHSTVV